MAFENKELAQMAELSRTNSPNILVGALCMSGMSIVTDMTSDMLYDKEYVREEGLPNLAKMIDMAADQVIVVFPDMVADNGEIDVEPRLENEKPFEMLVRAFMKQIIKQRPDLAKLEFQPR